METPRVFSRLLIIFVLMAAAARAEGPAPAVDARPVKKWLSAQERIHSLKADFMQTRSFHALRDPFVSPGTFWFVAPGSFRFEIGAPAKMISLRKGDAIYMIEPPKKRAEVFPVDQLQKKSSPALFRFPIAKDWDDFNRQFELKESRVEGNHAHIEVVSRDAMMRKLVTYARFDFEMDSGNLLAVEMAFKDGTSMRNEFTNVQINPKIDPAVFQYDLSEFQVTGGHP